MDFGLSLGSGFYKAHGHGNDYIVFEEGPGWPVFPVTVKEVCHRQRGVGGDGIVALLSGPPGGASTSGSEEDRMAVPFCLRMFNPDGSEFERSGNGLRVLGAHLFSSGRVEMGRPFPVEVGGGRVEMVVLGQDTSGVLDVAVEMGRVQFGVGAVAGDPEKFGAGTTLEPPGETPLVIQPVSVGNPHCVVFRDQLDEVEFLRLGPWLASNPAFSRGTNVQFVRVLGGGGLEILIWERGVGRTASSGTSACAAASAAVQNGLLPPGRIPVIMEGGTFEITVSPEMEVRLQGPVQPIMEGSLMPARIGGLAGMVGVGEDSGPDPGKEQDSRR